MKLGADNETLAENKVLILYLLSIIDKPVNNDSLYRLVLSIQDMNYFYFQQFLLDLIEDRIYNCIWKGRKWSLWNNKRPDLIH